MLVADCVLAAAVVVCIVEGCLPHFTCHILCGAALQVKGSVQYNGKDFSGFVVERTAAYVDQVSL
jgi:hypothetical protein